MKRQGKYEKAARAAIVHTRFTFVELPDDVIGIRWPEGQYIEVGSWQTALAWLNGYRQGHADGKSYAVSSVQHELDELRRRA